MGDANKGADLAARLDGIEASLRILSTRIERLRGVVAELVTGRGIDLIADIKRLSTENGADPIGTQALVEAIERDVESMLGDLGASTTLPLGTLVSTLEQFLTRRAEQ